MVKSQGRADAGDSTLPDSSGPESVDWRPLEAAGTRQPIRAGAARCSERRQLAQGSAMVLSAADTAAVRALWKKLGNNVGVYTTEALERCGQAPAPSGLTCLSARSGDETPVLLEDKRPHQGCSISLSVPPSGPSWPSPPL